MEQGDHVRIKDATELALIDGWIYDPFIHCWKHTSDPDLSLVLSHSELGQPFTIAKMIGDDVFLYGRKEGVHISALKPYVKEATPSCTCGAAISGALGHYQWCDIGGSHGEV